MASDGVGAKEWKSHQMENVPVRLRIEWFEGPKELLTAGMTGDRGETAMSNVYVQVQLVNQGRPMGLPTRTGYTMFGSQCVWDHLVCFSHCHLSDLPRTAEIHLTLAALDAPRSIVVLGEASFRLFSKRGRLKRGRKKIALRLTREGAGPVAGEPPTGIAPAPSEMQAHPGDASAEGGDAPAGGGAPSAKRSPRSEMAGGGGGGDAGAPQRQVAADQSFDMTKARKPTPQPPTPLPRGSSLSISLGCTLFFALPRRRVVTPASCDFQLEKAIQRYERNTIDHVPWLDQLAFKRIEEMNMGMPDRMAQPTIVVELERWEVVISHNFKNYNVSPPSLSSKLVHVVPACHSPHPPPSRWLDLPRSLLPHSASLSL